jgi:hypothetical protein
MTARLPADEIGRIVGLIPDDWLEESALFQTKAEQREAYVRHFTTRLQAPRRFVEEAIRAHAVHV